MRRCMLIASSLWLAGCDAPRPDAPAATPDAGVQAIAQVQGAGARSPLEGRQVTVEGVVVANFAKGLGGVFVQSQADDGDPATAEGLFLPRRPDAEPRLRLGDHVRATGRVVEQGEGDQTLTSLQAQAVEVLGRGNVTPRVLSEVPAAGWESVEGELLSITAPLTVTGNDGLARYGELATSFGGRLYAPTEVAPPGAGAQAVARENARLSLRLDDARSGQDPKTLWFLPGAWNDAAPLRTGSVITGVQGVLDQRFGSHRLQLTEEIGAIEQAPRPAAPTVPGDRRIAGFNVLNLFNGDGRGGGFPTDRGAATPADHARQVAKLVAAVRALDPDLAALMELENDGFGPDSSLAQFVDALNAAGPHTDWRFVDAGEGPGSNAIRVGIVYRSSRFQAVGRPATINETPFARSSRAPLAQAFRASRGPVFVVVANHFKSKGGCDKATGGDADSGDGQACYNATRVASARQLNEWLATDPTGTSPAGSLVLGDLNAHAQEDPLRLLYSRGWRDAFALVKAERPYSFVWAGQSARLDHALLDVGLAGRLRGAAQWHANADESDRFDYRRDRENDPWRASDHDPMLLGLDLAR
ncbi:MAG: nuclease [Lysobacteraceae bacterium]|nr:MAG: nuclease [Xanthomonadaceae bacterium]